MSALTTIVAFGVGFALFNIVDFSSIGGGMSRRSSDQYFYLNQMNSNTSRGMVHLDENYVYIVSLTTEGEIQVFDHNFNEESSIRVRDDGIHIGNFYITDDVIYYTTLWGGDLYRFDRETGENQQLASNIFHQTIVGDQVFHLSESWDSNIYVFDKANDETRVVFEGDVRQFSINSSDDTIIFIEEDSGDDLLYRIDFDGSNLERLNINSLGFAFDGETLAWGDGGFYEMDINTGTKYRVAQGISSYEYILIIDDYIVFLGTKWCNESEDFERGLYILNRSTNHLQKLEEYDVIYSFAVVDDYIVYVSWESFNMYVMDFEGNSRMLVENEFGEE